MRNPLLFLNEILEAMETAQRFVEGMDLEEFMSDPKTRSAVAMQVGIMGEAAKSVPAPIRSRCPEVAFKSMAGMRDRIMHGYFSIDYALIWRTVRENVPKEEPHLRRLIEDLEREDDEGPQGTRR
jgi:uncharacterized protein with HEPN domain